MKASNLILYILPLISLLLSYFVFFQNEFFVFLLFAILVPIYAISKWDGRIPIAYALGCLIISAVLLTLKNKDLADQFAIYVYWLLCSGTIILLIETILESRKNVVNDKCSFSSKFKNRNIYN